MFLFLSPNSAYFWLRPRVSEANGRETILWFNKDKVYLSQSTQRKAEKII